MNYLSKENRAMLEMTLFNLSYDMDCIGAEDEIWAELAALTDSQLETVLNLYMADL